VKIWRLQRPARRRLLLVGTDEGRDGRALMWAMRNTTQARSLKHLAPDEGVGKLSDFVDEVPVGE